MTITFTMQGIWDELSKPLPPSAEQDVSSVKPVVTSQERHQLVTILEVCDYDYHAEGRANVVFTIKAGATSNPDSGGGLVLPVPSSGFFDGTLLRVPKATPGVTACDYETLQDFHEKLVEVKVGRQHIVPQLLVNISRPVADLLNARRGHRDDGSVIQAGYAMLIQDMSPTPRHLALEFKPKWLAQSPLAPRDATRCRTCAREAFRNSQLRAKGKTEKVVSPPICPLGLLHDNRALVMSTMDRLAPRWSAGDRERLADALRDSGLLERLRKIQTEGDPDRALFDDPGDPMFGLAMTLRDCSCFVRVPAAKDEPVVIKLADVDKKNWQQKQTYWQDSHRNLVENGWYVDEKLGETAAEKGEPTACILQLDVAVASGDPDGVPLPFRERLTLTSP